MVDCRVQGFGTRTRTGLGNSLLRPEPALANGTILVALGGDGGTAKRLWMRAVRWWFVFVVHKCW